MSDAPDSDGDSLPDSPFEPVDGGGGDPVAGDTGGGRGLLGRLKNTEPNRSLDDVGDLDTIRNDYGSYGLRGLEKFAGADDAWAGVDLLKFAVGATLNIADNTGDDSDGDSQTDSASATDVPISGDGLE